MTTMTTIGTPTMSDYDGRIVEISVTGVCHQNIKRMSSYTMKVPHHRLNDAMREIYSLGGKITDINVLGHKSEAKVVEKPPAQPSAKVAEKPPTIKSKTPAKKRVSKSTTASKRRTSASKSSSSKRTRRPKH